MVKVFLVEDEKFVREGIKNEIDWNSYGFDFVGEAADGELALPLIEISKPDILITDIKMPFMDGLELGRIVKERFPDTVIIFLSGYDDFDYAQKAIHIGASEYLLKPVSKEKLISVLKKIKPIAESKRHSILRNIKADNMKVFFLSKKLFPLSKISIISSPPIPAIIIVSTSLFDILSRPLESLRTIFSLTPKFSMFSFAFSNGPLFISQA